MKKLSIGTGLSTALCGLLLLLAFTPSLVGAIEFRAGESPTHPADEVWNEDLYMFGGSVTSSGVVRGDLIVSGGNVLINGQVYGDVAAGGGNVSIVADVGDDVRVGGGTVMLQGAVTGDVLIAGGQVNVSTPKIGGGLTVGGGVVRIDGQITRDVQIAGGDVRIDAAINGDLDIQAEKIVLGPNANIAGNFTYKSPEAATLEEGAQVRGETSYSPGPNVREAAKLGVAALFSVWFVAKVIMIFSGALVVAYVFQRFAAELVRRSTKDPISYLGRGVVFLIVTPIVSILLLVSVIGIAFGALGMLGFIGALIFGTMLTPLLIGTVLYRWVFKSHEYVIDWKTVALGTVVYVALGFVPFVGWLATAAVMLIALGAALSIKMQVIREWR